MKGITDCSSLWQSAASHSYGYLADVPHTGEDSVCILAHIMESRFFGVW